ncbi:MAG: hypothetical protein J1E00_09855 [Oscillospiraceae bacterium]|nr:hypothetical protein [Oscillospiraceae bacterium]
MRTQKALKNVLASIGAYIVLIALGLIVRRLFLHQFETELIGYDALLTNIFDLLSIADLGADGFFSYRLYHAFAEDDRGQITKLLSMYRKIYLFMGVVVSLICLALFFCLPYIFSGKVNFWSDFRLMYILYSIVATASYFLNYWRTLLVAGQLEYKCVRIETAAAVANLIAKTLVLLTVRSYLLYLLINTATAIIRRILIALTAKKEYPFVKPVPVPWSGLRTEDFTEEIRNLLPIKFAGAINGATDSLLITLLVDVTTTGLYGNYILIGNYALNGFRRMLSPLQASVADLVYKETKDDALSLYKMIELICFIFATMVFSGFAMVFQNAIAVFFGTRYWLSMSFVFSYAVLGYIAIRSQTAVIFRGCFGEFQIERRFSVVGAAINLLVSVVLLRIWGVTGVLFGTVIAQLFVWHGRMVIVEKKLFGRPFWTLWCTEVIYFLLACAELGLTWLALRNVPYSFWNMWIRCFGSVLIPTACNVLIFWHTTAFQDILFRIKMVLAKIVENKQ